MNWSEFHTAVAEDNDIPTAVQIEAYIFAASNELGPSVDLKWVKWCEDTLRKSIGQKDPT